MLILNELNGEYLAKSLKFFLKLFFAPREPDERAGKLRLPMGSEWRPMVRADVVLNVIEVRPFIFKVSDLGEIIGKLEGIYLRGLKRRRGKELGAVWRDCWAGWTLDKKKRGRGEVPSVPGFVVRGLPLIHDKTVDEWGTEVLGYFMTGPPAENPWREIHSHFFQKSLAKRHR